MTDSWDCLEERKLAADELLKNGDYGNACEKYRQCLCGLKVDDDSVDESKKDLFVRTCCNASLACARSNRAMEALFYSEKALAARPGNIKGLYRKAHALRMLNNLTEAVETLDQLEKALDAAGKTSKDVQNEKKALQNEIDKYGTACSLATMKPEVQKQIVNALHTTH